MAYATTQDLITRFGEQELVELTDRAEPATGEVDAAVAGQALASADAEVDGFLRARYSLPLGSVPSLIVELACAIARYKLFGGSGPDYVRKGYEDALARLKDLSAGRMKLDIAGVEPAAAPDAIQVQSEDRIFSRTTMRGL